MNRRDLLRSLGGGVAAATAAGRSLSTVTVDGQSIPSASGRPSAGDLGTRLAASIEKHNVPGVSAAVFRDGQWDIAAAGVTNVTTGVAATLETVMQIGSITKVLTATLIMQLVDEGRVELSAPVKRYLPDFRTADREVAEQITVEMLLNHTCGIDGEYFPGAGPDAERIEDVISSIERQGQIHAPGAEASYCNSGVVLAGYLAQRLLGKSWYTLIEERIFEPLELVHSVVQPAHALLHRAAVGHFRNSNGTNTRTSFPFLHQGFAPAGATAMLTARDLATFVLAHVSDGMGANGHRLLSAASAHRMRRQTAAWRGIAGGGVGLAWMTMDNGIVGHDGGGPGIVSRLYADPATKTVAVILTNAMHGLPVLNEITAPLYDAAGVRPPWVEAEHLARLATDAPVDPHPYVGMYESVTTAFRVTAQGRSLALQVRPKMLFYDGDSPDESPQMPLRPIRDGHFIGRHGFVTFINPGADGRMEHLVSGGARLYRRSR